MFRCDCESNTLPGRLSWLLSKKLWAAWWCGSARYCSPSGSGPSKLNRHSPGRRQRGAGRFRDGRTCLFSLRQRGTGSLARRRRR
ncbi:hypothetical protein PoB_005776700 [Plakobranchus ocellatus]|uniref:Uncharacterized protein n=1 Tax=Plakobranchus ocellatus TaxID=259542 RepID=A0AAV4CIU1_9GAST|nr:hypothetical protein PoB_005776700 [Plakobranchus ocellatus]